jgi:hypothetical protein
MRKERKGARQASRVEDEVPYEAVNPKRSRPVWHRISPMIVLYSPYGSSEHLHNRVGTDKARSAPSARIIRPVPQMAMTCVGSFNLVGEGLAGAWRGPCSSKCWSPNLRTSPDEACHTS